MSRRSYANRPGLREHTAEEAAYVLPHGADPGKIEDAPETIEYFWITTEGEPYENQPDGKRQHHVGAEDEQSARASIEHIEEVEATGRGGHGGEPWKITKVEAASRHVDPSGEAIQLEQMGVGAYAAKPD